MELFFKNSVKPWFDKIQVNRDLIIFINRCRFNHYNLNKSLYKLNVVNEPFCQWSNYKQDLNHIVWHSILFENQRIKLLKRLSRCNLYPPLDIKTFLAEPNILVMKIIFCFFKDCILKIWLFLIREISTLYNFLKCFKRFKMFLKCFSEKSIKCF